MVKLRGDRRDVPLIIVAPQVSLLRCCSSVRFSSRRTTICWEEGVFISHRRLREEVTSLFSNHQESRVPIFWRNVCQHSMTDKFPRVPADNLRPVVQSSCQCHLMFFHHLLHNTSRAAIFSSRKMRREPERAAQVTVMTEAKGHQVRASGSVARDDVGDARLSWRLSGKKIWPELRAKRSQCAGMWRNDDGALFVTLRYESQLAVSSYTYSVKELRNCI